VFTWAEIADYIRNTHPELASRLPSKDLEPLTTIHIPVDLTFAEEMLGLKEYIPWQETIEASLMECSALDNALEEQKKQGN
jgi:hypothetical protein